MSYRDARQTPSKGEGTERLWNRRVPGDLTDANLQHFAGPTNFARIWGYAENTDADPRLVSLLCRPRKLLEQVTRSPRAKSVLEFVLGPRGRPAFGVAQEIKL